MVNNIDELTDNFGRQFWTPIQNVWVSEIIGCTNPSKITGQYHTLVPVISGLDIMQIFQVTT